jgi:hypothetical protein
MRSGSVQFKHEKLGHNLIWYINHQTMGDTSAMHGNLMRRLDDVRGNKELASLVALLRFVNRKNAFTLLFVGFVNFYSFLGTYGTVGLHGPRFLQWWAKMILSNGIQLAAVLGFFHLLVAADTNLTISKWLKIWLKLSRTAQLVVAVACFIGAVRMAWIRLVVSGYLTSRAIHGNRKLRALVLSLVGSLANPLDGIRLSVDTSTGINVATNSEGNYPVEQYQTNIVLPQAVDNNATSDVAKQLSFGGVNGINSMNSRQVRFDAKSAMNSRGARESVPYETVRQPTPFVRKQNLAIDADSPPIDNFAHTMIDASGGNSLTPLVDDAKSSSGSKRTVEESSEDNISSRRRRVDYNDSPDVSPMAVDSQEASRSKRSLADSGSDLHNVGQRRPRQESIGVRDSAPTPAKMQSPAALKFGLKEDYDAPEEETETVESLESKKRQLQTLSSSKNSKIRLITTLTALDKALYSGIPFEEPVMDEKQTALIMEKISSIRRAADLASAPPTPRSPRPSPTSHTAGIDLSTLTKGASAATSKPGLAFSFGDIGKPAAASPTSSSSSVAVNISPLPSKLIPPDADKTELSNKQAASAAAGPASTGFNLQLPASLAQQTHSPSVSGKPPCSPSKQPSPVAVPNSDGGATPSKDGIAFVGTGFVLPPTLTDTDGKKKVGTEKSDKKESSSIKFSFSGEGQVPAANSGATPFSFGSVGAPASVTSDGFAFAGPSSAGSSAGASSMGSGGISFTSSSSSSAGPSFSFGSASAPAPPAPVSAPPSAPVKMPTIPALDFGGLKPDVSNEPASTNPTAGFSCGGAASSSSVAGSAAPATAPFSFGGAAPPQAAPTAASQKALPPMPTFGFPKDLTKSAPEPGGATSSGILGTLPTGSVPVPSSTPNFSFGGAASTVAAAPAAATAQPFSFGGSSSLSSDPAKNAPSTSAALTGAPPATTGFGFGASASTQPATNSMGIFGSTVQAASKNSAAPNEVTPTKTSAATFGMPPLGSNPFNVPAARTGTSPTPTGGMFGGPSNLSFGGGVLGGAAPAGKTDSKSPVQFGGIGGGSAGATPSVAMFGSGGIFGSNNTNLGGTGGGGGGIFGAGTSAAATPSLATPSLGGLGQPATSTATKGPFSFGAVSGSASSSTPALGMFGSNGVGSGGFGGAPNSGMNAGGFGGGGGLAALASVASAGGPVGGPSVGYAGVPSLGSGQNGMGFSAGNDSTTVRRRVKLPSKK